jgi:hypothetical protein
MALTASTWKPINVIGLNQNIEDTSTTQKHDLGFRVRCKDTSSQARGFAEFVYLKGVASTAAGDAVVYDTSDNTTVRTVAASHGPVGVAMSANVASQFGWYQTKGLAIVTAGTVADNGLVYTTATDGSLDDAQVDSQQILKAKFRVATDTGQAVVELDDAYAGTDDQLA